MFLAIAKAMEEMVEDHVDCYWIIRCFVNQLNNKYRDFLPQLVRDDFLAVVGIVTDSLVIYPRNRLT